MTLPQNVKNAVAQLDNAMMFHADDLSYASWTAIRAHLLSQEAEIERLQSRLAAADALLRECLRYLNPHHYPDTIKRIATHLSENAHG